MDELTEKVGKALAGKLSDFQFLKSQWALTRKFKGGWQAIVIEALPTSKAGFAKLSAHGQVRIDALESVYTQYNPYLTDRDAKTHPTVVVNCDELFSDKNIANAFSTDPDDIALFVNVYAEALKCDVVPWLERYSDEQNVYEGLAGSNPEQWITSDRLIRYPVLLTILSKRGDWGEFNKIAEEFTKYCDKPHAQVYRPYAEALIIGLARG